MSTAAAPGPAEHSPKPAARSKRFVEYDRFIETQLRKTRGHVRGVDIAGSLLVLLTGTFVYFLAIAVAEHWIVMGGFGFWMRLLLLAVYATAACYYFVTHVLPPLIRRINPVYAALTIERSKPSLKNSLVNFLLFRSNPAGISEVMYQAIEEQAALNLAKVPVEAAVDRSKLIKLGYLFISVLFVAALYYVLSPKDPLRTVSRVIMPWSEIQPATRVRIVDVEPAGAKAFVGERVPVSAEIQRLAASDEVTLYYTTADGQAVDRPIRMEVPPDAYRYACVLPESESGLQQDLEFRIEAGDARSKTFQVEVTAAPTLVVQSVDYAYPEYTGLLRRRTEHEGDIKAIEGTEVTIHALANQEIKTAQIDFGCDGRDDQRMTVHGREATARFTLALNENRSGPEHANYQLHFTTETGQENPQPIRHLIEVTADLAPEIEFLAPKREEVEVPANGSVEMEITAQDPDFALRHVRLLSARVGGKARRAAPFEMALLDKPWRGSFNKRFRFEPQKAGFKAGDVVEYWGTAEDIKQPQPNRAETARRRLRITSPLARPPADQVAQAEKQRRKNNPENSPAGDGQAEDENERPQPGQGGAENEPDQEPSGDDEAENPQAGQKNAGDGENEEDQKPGEGAPAQQKGRGDEGPKSADKDSAGANDQAGEQPAGQQPGGGDKQKPGDPSKAGGQKGGQRSDKSDEQQNQGEGPPETVPNDGTADGNAFDEILKHREQKNQQDGAQPNGQGQKSAKPEQGPQQKPQKSNDERRPQPGEDRQPGAQNGDQEPGQQAGEEKSPQQPPGGAKQNGDERQPAGKQPSGENQPNAERGAGQEGGQGNEGQDAQGGDSATGKKSDKKSEAGEKSERGAAEKGGRADQKRGKPAPGSKQEAGEREQANGDGQGDREKPGAGEKPSGKQKPSADNGAEGQPQDNANPERKSEPARGKAGDAQKPTRSSDKNDKGDNASPKAGQGAQAKGDDAQGQPKPAAGGEKPEAKGGDGENEKGESGAGRPNKGDEGAPNLPDQNQQQRKKSKPGADDPSEAPENEAKSPSTSKRESDSQGEGSGEQSGGGEDGGGQKANQKGTGGAGSNTAADEGAGQSKESGKGNASQEAGKEGPSSKPTGQAGQRAGDGSSSKSQGSKEPGQGGGASDAQKAQSPNQQNGSASGQNGPTGGGGGGQPGETDGGAAPNAAGEKTEPDDPNLDYAKKATDLALEHLKHELSKDKPDQELLDKLGWTKQDLQQFIDRWEKMQREARDNTPKGQQAREELDAALRSLGIRPRSTVLRSASGRDDRTRNLKESRRAPPPPEYAEQLRAYTQGTSGAGAAERPSPK